MFLFSVRLRARGQAMKRMPPQRSGQQDQFGGGRSLNPVGKYEFV
jgi:hypothetical protein